MGGGFETSELTPEDAASGFQSGSSALDVFFQTQAGQNQRKNVSRTWVIRRPEGDDRSLPPVLGFYTLTLGAVERERLPGKLSKKMPQYPVPVVLIGRLATDLRARGQRVGERLLLDAHDRALAVSEQAGVVGIIVDAKDEKAAGFYGHYGYQVLEQPADAPAWPRRMFIALATVRTAVER